MNSPVEKIFELFLKHPSVEIDSRNIKKGDIFFALKGERFDGNTFAKECLLKGASVAVVDNPNLKDEEGCIYVEDSLKALQLLANRYRKSINTKVIGITGSNGKTTTKELIAKTLSATHKVHATKGNLNNHIGVPLTLLQIKRETAFAVVEMGANHPGEIDLLCNIAEPDYGIITNIGKAHLEGFGGFEGVIRTKTELYRYILKRQGQIFINVDNPLLVKHSKGLNTITYGTSGNEYCAGKLISSFPFLKLNFKKQSAWIELNSQLAGSYNFENILAAICIGLYFDVKPKIVKSAIESYVPSNNRSQLVKTKKNRLILDAYNANPSSMEASVRYFADSEFRNKALILGEMLELGEESKPEHSLLVKLVQKLGFNEIYYVGLAFKQLVLSGRWFESTDDLINYLSSHPLQEKTILIKGSRGNALEKIVDYL